MRTFIALDLPGDVIAQVMEWQAANLPENVYPEPANNLHMTLGFLGETDPAILPQIREMLDYLSLEGIVLSGPTGYRETPKAAFLTYSDTGGQEFWAKMNEGMYQLTGYQPQFSPWLPHITVWKYPQGQQPGFQPTELPAAGSFSPVGVGVYQSVSNAPEWGATYEKVAKRHTSNIFDPIQETLDQQVFTGIEPKPYHLDFINRLYQRALKNELGVSGDGWVDLYFTGSLTTYQYSETSDADISVFPNWERFLSELGMDAQTARKHLISLSIDHIDGTFLAGTTHPLQFFVVPQGVLPSDLYQPGLRSAYSIDDRLWYQEPEKDRVHEIASELPEFFTRASDIAEKMSEMLDHAPESARTLWHDVHKKRQLDQQAGLGDFCEGNIVYKYLLHEGLFDRIRDELGEYIAKTGMAWHDEQSRVEWQQGKCDTYAKAMLDMYPHLRMGILAEHNEYDGWTPQHFFAHDDQYAYDSIGRHTHPYKGINPQFPMEPVLDENPADYGFDYYPYGENGDEEDYERAKQLIPQQHPWLGEYIAKTALDARDYEGETGNKDHITRVEKGEVPTEAIANLKGVKGELPGEHRNKQDEKWAAFLDDVRENGIREPIFITVDYGEEPLISEGNHRRDAAVELGLPSVPVEVRYFGGAQPIRTSSINFEVWSDEFPPDMPEPPPGIDPMGFNNWTDEEYEKWMAYEDARHEANPSINLSNSNAMDFFRWLGLPDMDYAGTLDPHLLKQLLAEKAAEPPSPMSPTIDWQGEAGGTNIDIGRPEGYMNERARQMEELADLAIQRKGIISFGKVAAPTQVTRFPNTDNAFQAQFGTAFLIYSIYDNKEHMEWDRKNYFEINGPYLFPDDGGEVIYINWAGSENHNMDDPEPRDVVAIAQYLRSLNKPVYGEIINEPLLELAERKFKMLSWTEDPEDRYLIPQDVVDRSVAKMQCIHCQSHLLLDGSKPYCGNCGWEPAQKIAMPPAAEWEDFADSIEERQIGDQYGDAYFVNDCGLRWRYNRNTLKNITHLLGTAITFDVSRGWMEGFGTLAYKILPGATGNMYMFTITLNNILSPEAASYSLWHEIQHAFQLVEERMDAGHASPANYMMPKEWEGYITDPVEVDADEMAAKMRMIEELPVVDVIPITEGSEKEYYEEMIAEGWPEDEALDMLTGLDEEISLDHVLKARTAADTSHLWEKVNTKVIYDFERDNIILGTQALATDLPDTKIIGEYDGEAVTLFEAEKQWINPDYFHRLWAHTFPNRPLHGVYYKRDGGEPYKLKTRTRPQHAPTR